jgi:hypothetical protein
MPGSAVADIQDTYGAALIGLLVSTVCVFLLSFPARLLSLPTHSLYGVTVTQM